ncbi:O-acetyl-ADP-ribose deacetylase [Psychrilyobacter atlanticus]|uniref:O-acetyl-ADP-ribose deacetylase n=1 Tax=Psychrilyobacter atlanticus TaxID=271091 RepID=UPI00041FFC8E|nr:O-acetyl-ADP-ribose deacetylase [Psychrilyobacter atlanticus]
MSTKYKIIEVIKGDITKLKIDAIVNAANNGLFGGGGVDGAIHRAGGKEIADECKIIRESRGGCKTGEAVITTGGNLEADYVIHTVGPVWDGERKGMETFLSNCYKNSLTLAVQNNIETIAFPCISTGIYGFPKDLAAEIAISTIIDFLKNNVSIKKIILVCFEDESFNIYKFLLSLYN